jgi:hypothetical protein
MRGMLYGYGLLTWRKASGNRPRDPVSLPALVSCLANIDYDLVCK